MSYRILFIFLLICVGPMNCKCEDKQLEAGEKVVRTLEIKHCTRVPKFKFYAKVDAPFYYELQSSIDGKIGWVSGEFAKGGKFSKDEVMAIFDNEEALLDVAKYSLDVSEAQKELKMAITYYSLEQRNLEFLGLDDEAVLNMREKDVADSELKLEAAQKQLDMLTSSLEVRASFDCLVVERNVGVGNIVSRGTTLAKICKYDEMIVPLDMKFEDLNSIEIPGYNCERGEGSKVKINNTYEGEIVGIEARFTPTSLARVRILVKNEGYEGFLRAGQFCEVSVAGKVVDGVFVDGSLLDSGDIWIVDEDGKVAKKQANILFEDEKGVIIRDVFAESEKIIDTSSLNFQLVEGRNI